MSRPIVVTACMLGSTIVATTIGDHLNGTYLPVEEPSTASEADQRYLLSHTERNFFDGCRRGARFPRRLFRLCRRQFYSISARSCGNECRSAASIARLRDYAQIRLQRLPTLGKSLLRLLIRD